MADNGKAPYSQGKNWTASGGQFYNGQGTPIADPTTYFAAVGENRHGYNSSFSNGHGKVIDKPQEYFKAVASDKYGYNSK